MDDVRVPVVSPRSTKQLEALAQELLLSCAPSCLEEPQATPMLRIFDQDMPRLFGFQPLVQEMAPGLEGITDIAEKTVALAVHVYDGLENNDGRSRFSAAHEVAHVVAHRGEEILQKIRLVSGGTIQLARRSEIVAYLDPEWQANAFAAALLMPRNTVEMFAKTTNRCNLASAIADHFNVSFGAAAIRARRLKLIN